MVQIERRLAALEAAPQRSTFDGLTLPELHAKAITAIAEAIPDHAAALQRAGKRIAAGDAAWPWHPIGDDADHARAVIGDLLAFGA
ncbi:hypothetical protein AiwAL_16840 [Acidiphilium sp. AL]|uniref:hypothetical protein n=1 Tax=Acidiphilium sp. AL TaxID=2871704 RepID=UPI0021CB79EC|nr:hypothetical protein [Acidiphilium sp. AL]MCU4161747.1 hypothetical protein [Acidiphilium sp. AL]